MGQIISGAIFGFSIALIEYVFTHRPNKEVKQIKQEHVSIVEEEPVEEIVEVEKPDQEVFETLVFESGASLEELDDLLLCEEDLRK